MPMELSWFQWMALVALGICLIFCLLHFIRLIRLGKPNDFSKPAGTTGGAIRYAFTGAMSPAKKESAFLHLPTYIAGLLYHTGTFLGFFLFFFFLLERFPSDLLAIIITFFFAVTSLCGLSILIKRMVKRELRSLSNPDDFISNLLVTSFQLLTFMVLLIHVARLSGFPELQPAYYLVFSLLMLYTPVGKLRHMIYFFAARYHLGHFFGRRGVWPDNRLKS
jgi:hypothetical protein